MTVGHSRRDVGAVEEDVEHLARGEESLPRHAHGLVTEFSAGEGIGFGSDDDFESHWGTATSSFLRLARSEASVRRRRWRRIDGARVYWREVEARLATSELIARHYEARAFLPSYGEDDAGYAVFVKR